MLSRRSGKPPRTALHLALLALAATLLVGCPSTPTVNHAPVAEDATLAAPMGAPVEITLDGHDPDGDPLVFDVVAPPGHGTLTGDPPDVTYTPDPGYVGWDEFAFTVSDGALTSAPARVGIEVGGGVDEPPDLEPLPHRAILIGESIDVPLTVHDDTPGRLFLEAFTNAPDIVAPGDLTILGEGGPWTLRITPSPCHAGTATITVVVADPAAQSDTETFDLHVENPFQDTPTRLVASGGDSDDLFGHAVAIDGDDALVGATWDSDDAALAGAVYAFRRDESGWVEQMRITASDGAAYQDFGGSVDLDGDYAIVGAYGDTEKGSGAGAAYVLERIPGGWTEGPKLTASDAAIADVFGISVGLDGDYAIVGAFREDTKAPDAGAAYVFHRAGSAWSQVAKLTADDGAAYAYFGEAVAIDGDDAIVGAPGADGYAGAAYVFHRTAGGWSQAAKLTTSDGVASDAFGTSVAISGDYAVAGCICDLGGVDEGAAYLFQRTASGWVQLRKLSASDAAQHDEFGASVAIDGGYVLVGAPGHATGGIATSGAAYVFQSCGDAWKETARLASHLPTEGARYGTSVALHGGEAIVGAQTDDVTGPTSDEGAAYVHTR